MKKLFPTLTTRIALPILAALSLMILPLSALAQNGDTPDIGTVNGYWGAGLSVNGPFQVAGMVNQTEVWTPDFDLSSSSGIAAGAAGDATAYGQTSGAFLHMPDFSIVETGANGGTDAGEESTAALYIENMTDIQTRNTNVSQSETLDLSTIDGGHADGDLTASVVIFQ